VLQPVRIAPEFAELPSPLVDAAIFRRYKGESGTAVFRQLFQEKAMLRIFVAGVLFCAVISPAWVDDDKPDISTIMKKVNGKKAGLHRKIGDGLKAGTINWDDVAKETKEYYRLADFLGKNDPPQGDKDSWAKLTKDYAANVKKLNDAALKKDKDSAQKSLTTLDKSCGACHKEHKP
jgi:hypothetical protein